MLIINTLFDFYILLVLLRFILQMLRADFYNPISQFIVKMTAPPLVLLRRVVPSIAGQDTASIVLCLILIYIKFIIIRLLEISHVPISSYMAPIGGASYLGLFIIAIADLIALIFTVFVVAVFIQVILSWFGQSQYNPLIGLVHRIAEPVLKPFRKFVPPMGGFDLSPIFAILLLMVGKMLLVPPIVYLGSF